LVKIVEKHWGREVKNRTPEKDRLSNGLCPIRVSEAGR